MTKRMSCSLYSRAISLCFNSQAECSRWANKMRADWRSLAKVSRKTPAYTNHLSPKGEVRVVYAVSSSVSAVS